MASGRRGEPEVRSDSSLRPTCVRIGVCCAWRYVGVIGSVRVRVTLASLLPHPTFCSLLLCTGQMLCVSAGLPTRCVILPLPTQIWYCRERRVKSQEERGDGQLEARDGTTVETRGRRRRERVPLLVTRMRVSRSRSVLQPWVPQGPL